ncbi:MAG: threonine--tRNA ligase [Candidatus Hadarchaeales archaeon]
MRILLIHADFLEFETKQPTPLAEELPQEKKSGRLEEVLVVFSAAEEEDEADLEGVAEKAAREIADVASQVKAERIAIYPYAHLSPSLASPKAATRLLDLTAEKLRKLGFETYRLPFGWYKAFRLSCKGHPLSELSRQITPEKAEVISQALAQEEKITSSWYVMEPDGKMHEIKLEGEKIVGYDFSKEKNLELFAIHEIKRQREAKEEPPHIQLMKRLELVDYEEGSDSGNFKFYPKGRFVKNLLETWVREKVTSYGAMEVETPIMYDYEHPALKDYLERFPARQYTLKSTGKRLFLRFSACFGQFLMISAGTISYRHLPMKLYELTRYSFRLEKAGELAGLRRLRAFTMPDMHTFCKNEEEAKKEFLAQFRLCMQCLKELGFSKNDYETGFRASREFLEKNREFVVSIAKAIGRPILLEIWSRRYAYFDPKFEFNFVDAIGKASALSTVQMDHENAKRYGITYVDENNQRQHPVILHCSPSGSLERVIYALLEKAYKEQKEGKAPVLPLWLSPTQVRLIPLADRHLKFCEKIAKQLSKSLVRVDIDDRAETVQKKVRDAEREWIWYIVVIGDKELKSKKLPVRVRGKKTLRKMTVRTLSQEISKKTKGMPFALLPLPLHLSDRPIFVGGSK